MEKVTFTLPPKKKAATKLWELAEKAGAITETKPQRWLRSGEWALEHAMIHWNEIKDTSEIKSKPKYFTWLVNKYKTQ